ncbi:MAG: saccharopine dehydrogenase NADP-binding domain-containing protein [Rhodoferax sp.]|nr:saccharopine dehydrogenase NADP-binding domain-containing protein [Rhodoferax sp.]
MARRAYDLILYGATGFVGRQTVAYIAARAGAGEKALRWAIAGRNRDKLEQVRRAAGAAAAAADIVVAGADEPRALNALARSTSVVLSTAGPFDLYGSQLVAACVSQRSHYVDITGETPWVSRLVKQHHARAAADGTRIIPCCGFDSVPSDLGAWLLVQAMHKRHAAECVAVKASFSIRGGLNGGTLASALNMLGSGQGKAMADVFLLNPQGERVRDPTLHADPLLPHFDTDFKAWLGPFVMGPVNTRVVRRSAALLSYPEAFHYQEYLRVGTGPVAAIAAASLSAGMFASSQAMRFGLLRSLAARVAPKPGEGPSVSRMDGGAFHCELLGRSGNGHVLRGRISDHGDPGNRGTTKMVCEAALALLFGGRRLPPGGGVLTPASGLGQVLVDRLRAAGMVLEVDP